MSHLRFHDTHFSPQQLLLQRLNAQARITALPGGVWRLLVSHRPEDHDKGSWAIPDDRRQPLALSAPNHSGGRIALAHPEPAAADAGDNSLLLNPSPFAWHWQGLISLGLTAEPVRSLLQAVPRQIEEASAHQFEGHPVREQLDGLSLGAGLRLDLLLEPEDRFYGLGERTGFLNKRGRRWHNWTTDEFFHGPKTDPLYQAHPFVILARDNQYLGLYLDESWYSCFDLGWTEADQWSIHTAGPTLDLYLIPGPDPADIVQRYTDLVGCAPLPPLWALGQHQCRWSYPDQESVSAVAAGYRAHDLPIDALWLDIDHMESYKVFSFSTRRFPDPIGLTRGLAQQGIKSVLIVDPGVKQEAGYGVYESGKAIDAFVHNTRDEELVGEVWPKPVVWPDFTQPAVRQWWGQLQQFYLDQGIAGIWNDMNEPAAFGWPNKTLPLDARQGHWTHAEVHNLYGTLMAEASYSGLKALQPDKRPFVLTRAGSPGVQRYAFVWTGDNASYWEHLEMSIPMLLNLGLSGVPFVGADIGGFSSDCDGELLAAWSWLGACYPFMRNHAGKGSRRQEPWQFGEPWLGSIREALHFRYRLLPWLYTLAEAACRDGLPIMRPLLLQYPHDPEVADISDQFLLGSDLLAAPITRPGQRRRLLYLPAGEWFDFWSGARFAGEQWHQIPASWRQLPLFQRGGAAIPLQPEAPAHTTDAHWPRICWQLAPAPEITGRLYSDAGDGFGPSQNLPFSARLQPGQSGQPGQLALDFDGGGREVHLRLLGHGLSASEHVWEAAVTQKQQCFEIPPEN
ncbi:MAG: alpha-glucosidase [Candidatus Sericytochromatia bacterium]|nr:alpha-glucosidase [Candidatus Sericytochromatia bacterium]